MGALERSSLNKFSSPSKKTHIIDFSNTIISKQYPNQMSLKSNLKERIDQSIVDSMQKEIDDLKMKENSYIQKLSE